MISFNQCINKPSPDSLEELIHAQFINSTESLWVYAGAWWPSGISGAFRMASSFPAEIPAQHHAEWFVLTNSLNVTNVTN